MDDVSDLSSESSESDDNEFQEIKTDICSTTAPLTMALSASRSSSSEIISSSSSEEYVCSEDDSTEKIGVDFSIINSGTNNEGLYTTAFADNNGTVNNKRKIRKQQTSKQLHTIKTKKPNISKDNREWKKIKTIRTIIPFIATPGPTFRRSAIPNCDGNIKPIHLFELFFDNALIQKLVAETNNYHSRRLQSSPIKHRMLWVDVTSNDIKVFIAICLAMGILKLPRIHDYWRQKQWFFAISSFTKVMSRDRFRQIHRYLHFCNETAAIPRGNEGYDKLFKVRMLLDDLCPKFRNLYKPKRDICIDESMIPFKGRISFRQFIPSKRTKFGIKAWVMAESATGYISEFLIYTGKDIDGLKDHDLAGTLSVN